MMKLISWNVNARVKDGPKQVKALSQQEPHVVALQDVRAASITQYECAFAEIGLRHVLHTWSMCIIWKPLSEIGETYIVDPIKDLRPVCPNCHVIIHKKNPAYSIDEVMEMIKTRA